MLLANVSLLHVYTYRLFDAHFWVEFSENQQIHFLRRTFVYIYMYIGFQAHLLQSTKTTRHRRASKTSAPTVARQRAAKPAGSSNTRKSPARVSPLISCRFSAKHNHKRSKFKSSVLSSCCSARGKEKRCVCGVPVFK